MVTADLSANDDVDLVEGVAHEGLHVLQLQAGRQFQDTWRGRYDAELPAYYTGFLVRNSFTNQSQSQVEIGRESHYRAGIGASMACANRCRDVPEAFRFRRR